MSIDKKSDMRDYNNLYNEGGEGYVPREMPHLDPIKCLRNRLAKAQAHQSDVQGAGYIIAASRVSRCQQALDAALIA